SRRRVDPFHQDQLISRELLRRGLQRQVPRRMTQRRLVHQPRRRQDEDRNLEKRLQRGQAAQLAWRPDADGVFINGRTRSLGGPEIGVRSLIANAGATAGTRNLVLELASTE